MNDKTRDTDAENPITPPDEKNPRDRQGFKENPATQGLKTPPKVEIGEDSGEWPTGGGSDPNEK